MKKMTFSFGRLNPPTIGHGKLLDALKKAAKGEYRMYLSNSHDRKRNPLSVSDKVKYTRLMFPKHSLYIMNDSKIVNVFDILVKLHTEGYEEVMMVVGSDRVDEFKRLMEQYNGVDGKRHGFYDFKRITVKSAGERDPDATGVEGMSASKMRKAVSDNDPDSFRMGLPSGFRKGQELFKILKKEMGVMENFKEWSKG